VTESDINTVDQVVQKLKPFLESLVTKTLQDLFNTHVQASHIQVTDQVNIVSPPHAGPAGSSAAPIDVDDDWDSMYTDDEPTCNPFTTTASSSVSQTTSHRSTPALSARITPAVHPVSSQMLQSPPKSNPSNNAPIATSMAHNNKSAATSQSHPAVTPQPLLHSSPTLPTPPASTPSNSIPNAWLESGNIVTLEQASGHSTFATSNHPAGSVASPTLDDALTCMGRLLRVKNARWSCVEQRVAMQAVLEREKDVLAIMRTSSGKSMLMVIPSMLEKNQITIGIVPLNSLLLDYSRKFKAQGIPFQIFHSHDSPTLHGPENLVITTVDQARTRSWKQQIGELNERIPVARVVFDEGHYAITDQDFRGVLDDVHELRQFAVQLVVLSATIPPKSEVTIREAFGLMEETFILRTPTCRPELQYILEEPSQSNSDIADRVEAIIKETKTFLQQEDRILIFVPYLDNGHILAKQLGCDFFCGGRNTASDEKDLMYHNWVEGVNQVMVCTNAFGAGNDYSHVRLVIHAGTPRHMMGYIQESSRAGRDKKPAKCIILPRKPGARPKLEDRIDHKGEQDMYTMLFGKGENTCINYALTLFNDGTGERCSRAWNGQKCNLCLNSSSIPMPSKGEEVFMDPVG